MSFSMRNWKDPHHAHAIIIGAAYKIDDIAQNLEPDSELLERLPLDAAAADAEAAEFIHKLHTIRAQKLGATALSSPTAHLQVPTALGLHYRFYRTPDLTFSHLTYQEVDDQTNALLAGEAIHLFDDTDHPTTVTTAIESANYDDDHLEPVPDADYNPWVMHHTFARLSKLYFEKFVSLDARHPSFGEQPQPNDTIRPFPNFEHEDPDPDQPA